MWLLCHTVGNNNGYAYGVVSMTMIMAKDLLEHREIFQTAREQDGSLYGMEYHDNEVTYHEVHDLDIDIMDEWTACIHCPVGSAEDDGRTTGETMQVTERGVLWSAYPKHGEANSEFETPILSWELIEAIVKGEVPFAMPDEDLIEAREVPVGARFQVTDVDGKFRTYQRKPTTLIGPVTAVREWDGLWVEVGETTRVRIIAPEE